jgi:putative ABC transport system substrate-binding protein
MESAAAPPLGLSLQSLAALNRDEIEAAMAAVTIEDATGLVAVQERLLLAQRSQIAELAAKNRFPAIYGLWEHVESGGLVADAASRTEILRGVATSSTRILKGAKPFELAVEQLTKLDLVINLKTAKALRDRGFAGPSPNRGSAQSARAIRADKMSSSATNCA